MADELMYTYDDPEVISTGNQGATDSIVVTATDEDLDSFFDTGTSTIPEDPMRMTYTGDVFGLNEPAQFKALVAGDSPNSKVNSETSPRKMDEMSFYSHPEGSFMALLNDHSEADLAQLLRSTDSDYKSFVAPPMSFYALLPEVREQIWRRLSPGDLKRIRFTCKKFKDEIDTEIGINLNLFDSDEESLRLAITTTIRRLVVKQMQMTTLGKLIVPNPLKLQSLRIQGPISRDTVHELLLRAKNLESLEIIHKFSSILEEETEDPDDQPPKSMYQHPESLQEWINGNLFRPADEIRYSYGCFNKLKRLIFHLGEKGLPVNKQVILTQGLLPLLQSINSHHLYELDIRIFILTLEETKAVTQALFEVFLKCRALKILRLKHFRTDSYTFEPIPNVDRERKTNYHVLKFSENRPFPQFEELILEMPEKVFGYFDWIYLLKSQRHLKKFVWDVGGNYWLYPVDCVVKSGKSVEFLLLRMIRCYQISATGEDLPPEPLSMGLFHEFISLKHFHLIGMELGTSNFSRMELLPKNIQVLQIECFHISPDQLFTIHKTLPRLKFLSVNHWNNTRPELMACLTVIGKMMVGHRGKYNSLTFMDRSMNQDSEQILEMNQVLDNLCALADANNLKVDEISGDNGIGFILVINAPPTVPEGFQYRY